MTGSVKEFMEKPYKTCACGAKAQKAKEVLTNAFAASGPDNAAQEGALFEKIVDSVMKTKKGRETLTALSKLGYSFAFEKGNFGGFCAPDRKKIVINPSYGFEYMLQTAVHEGQHAIQYSRESKNVPEFAYTQAASMLRMRRAIEADAVAHEMAFVYECKKVLPGVYRHAEKCDLPMFRAYVGEMDRSHDEKKAMQACFSSWYECDYYRGYYDETYRKVIQDLCAEGKQQKDAGLFSKEYPVADVLKMCCYKGRPYMTADSLNSGLPYSITKKDQKEISAAINDYAAAVAGAKADRSVQSMCLRNKNGKIIVPFGKSGKQAVVSTALSQRGR